MRNSVLVESLPGLKSKTKIKTELRRETARGRKRERDVAEKDKPPVRAEMWFVSGNHTVKRSCWCLLSDSICP